MSQKVLVAGTGKSGIAAAKLLLAMGGEVVLYDGNDKLDPEKIKENFEEGKGYRCSGRAYQTGSVRRRAFHHQSGHSAGCSVCTGTG